MFRVIVRGNIERQIVLRADCLLFFLQPHGDALGIQRVRFRKHDAEKIRREPVNGIRRAQFLGHSLGGVAPRLRILILSKGFAHLFRFIEEQ